MNEEKVKERLNDFKAIAILYDSMFSMNTDELERLQEDIETVLQLLEQKDKRIDDLEKALVEEAIKSTEKINKAIKRIKETRLDYFVVGQEVLEILEE